MMTAARKLLVFCRAEAFCRVLGDGSVLLTVFFLTRARDVARPDYYDGVSSVERARFGVLSFISTLAKRHQMEARPSWWETSEDGTSLMRAGPFDFVCQAYGGWVRRQIER